MREMTTAAAPITSPIAPKASQFMIPPLKQAYSSLPSLSGGSWRPRHGKRFSCPDSPARSRGPHFNRGRDPIKKNSTPVLSVTNSFRRVPGSPLSCEAYRQMQTKDKDRAVVREWSGKMPEDVNELD
jgi:hypothetical protein